MSKSKPVPGKDGNKYIPYEERTGDSSVVFFTRDLSEEGLKKIYDRVSSVLTGRVAIKLHTGEAEGPNIIPRPWVRELIETRLPEAAIIETNTYTPPRHTARPWRSTAGPSAPSTSPTAKAWPHCLSKAANGSGRCTSAKACSIMTLFWC